MSNAGLVVIGSGPAGIAAAEAFRKLEADAPIRIITEDPDPPYERPPLSKEFLRGDTDDVALHDAHWFVDRSIEIHRGRVTEIDVVDHALLLGDDRLPYDTLVIATGAQPVPLPVRGRGRALSLRSLADARRLRDAAARARSAVVVGAGFIGCEAAASLAQRGVKVTLVAPEAHPQEPRLGSEVGKRIAGLVSDAGAKYIGGVSVSEIGSDTVTLSNGRTLQFGLLLAATGVRPRIDLAEAADIRTEHGRIRVDQHMACSADNVYAVGDVAFAVNATAGRRIAVEHWQDAIEQGEVAGTRAAARQASWKAVPGFWTDIGDATLKYHAWGDGYDRCRVVDHGDGFTAWYERAGALVGVLTYDRDSDYDLGGRLIAAGRPAPQ